MEKKNRSENTPSPETDGKVPASGVMSETYKEEVNPKDLLGSSSPDPEESDRSREELNSYPLEEADVSPKKDIEGDRDVNDNKNEQEQDIDPSTSNDDEFLK